MNLKKMKMKANKEIEEKREQEKQIDKKKETIKEANQHVRELNKTKTYRKKDVTH